MVKAKNTKKRSKSPRGSASVRSFRIAKETTPFITFQITFQTVYWLILGTAIILAALWILAIQVEILNATIDLETIF